LSLCTKTKKTKKSKKNKTKKIKKQKNLHKKEDINTRWTLLPPINLHLSTLET